MDSELGQKIKDAWDEIDKAAQDAKRVALGEMVYADNPVRVGCRTSKTIEGAMNDARAHLSAREQKAAQEKAVADIESEWAEGRQQREAAHQKLIALRASARAKLTPEEIEACEL